jgi:inositol hexakisphosphate/diphosphoinositol-pentakisphosphate kinase
MDKKAQSKPMREIVQRLPASIRVCVFGNDTILFKPIEEWPKCDVLISFYSDGFPLTKAESYAALVRPHVINDLASQRRLLDRRSMYLGLHEAGVRVPNYAILSRDVPGQDQLEESEDSIVVNGKLIRKPFVEKPVDAEDHNINIYYPMKVGGGCKHLFRKVGDKSSEFYPNSHTVRRDGSFIYEEFINTQGVDVKVYSVGDEYAHAEARKSPVLDGVVNRDANGKEVRYPVILNLAEKKMVSKIWRAFGQTVCGFDLLRQQGGPTVVCDVNG